MPHNRANRYEVIVNGDVHKRLSKIGPSLWGNIYKTEDNEGYYRVIPVEQALPGNRQKTRLWRNTSGSSTIPIAESGQCQLIVNSEPFESFYIFYRTPSPSTWIDIMENPDLAVRLECASRIFLCFKKWREIFHDNPEQYFLPMPADIVFVDRDPFLLSMPFWGQPSTESCIEDIWRMIYLPPEFLLGRRDHMRGQNFDIYALGVSLFQCLYRISHFLNPEQLLLRVSSGTFFFEPEMKERFSFWMPRTPAFINLISDVKVPLDRDTTIRGNIKIEALGKRISLYVTKLDPELIINELKDKGKYRDAYRLIKDILLEQNNYELYIKAGELAEENLDKTLEAIDFFERGIALKPANEIAYRFQLSAIVNAGSKINLNILRELKDLVYRDFDKLTNENQRKFENDVIRYLIMINELNPARTFAYSRLFEEGNYNRFKFDIRLLYLEIMIRTGNLTEADSEMRKLRAGLQEAEIRHNIDKIQKKKFSDTLAILENKMNNNQ